MKIKIHTFFLVILLTFMGHTHLNAQETLSVAVAGLSHDHAHVIMNGFKQNKNFIDFEFQSPQNSEAFNRLKSRILE